MGVSYTTNKASAFNAYVNAYSDLQASFNNWVADSKNVHWGDYVRQNPDLEQYWNQYISGTGKTRWDWGYEHYQQYGKNESRYVPKVVSTPDINNRDTYKTITVSQVNGQMKPDDITRGVFGQFHWDSAGSKEDRIIPQTGPKFSIDNNGNLQVTNTDTIGEAAKERYNNIATLFNQSPGSDYMSRINSAINYLYNDKTVDYKDFMSQGGKTVIDTYYLKNKAPSPWDPTSLAVYPPDKKFDTTYYNSVRPQALQEWKNKINAPIQDLDFISRYGKTDPYVYLLQDYTNVGRHAGVRGSAPSTAEKIAETERLTDYEKQLYRDQVLGISGGKVVLSTPQYDEKGNLTNPEEINTLLEKKFAEVLTAKDIQKQKQFGTLAQDVLQTSIDALVQAKKKESEISFMRNLPGYNEIMDINTTLANSILGDTGLGGLLSMTGQYRDTQTSLQKDIEKITGVTSNSTIYNWQKWFDETLLKRYEDYDYEVRQYTDPETTTLQNQAKAEIDSYNQAIASGNKDAVKPIYLKIAEEKKLSIDNPEEFKKILVEADLESQKNFMSSFINDYIKPRFDQSKSMDEFVSYLNVTEDEQNIFQTQSTVNKLQQIAELRSKGFLDLVNQAETAENKFNPAFYLDPLANNTKEISATKQEQYALQKQIVAEDFANAKKNITGPDGINWGLQAYIYGYENTYKTNPDEFAKLHYQVKGSTGLVKDAQGKSFILDPAEDILPYEELQKKIENFGAELSLRKGLYGDTSFMQFVTPEEYADALLSSVDPTQNKEEWKNLLEKMGLAYTEDLNQVKNYLIDSFRTEEAKTIRENIKYLNETKQQISQKELGSSYIERPADKTTASPEGTVLYNVFKNAGYGGTEDDFYNEFMPDVDRSEQQVISKAFSEKGFSLTPQDMSDPLTAFSKISDFFGETSDPFQTETTTSPKTTSSTATTSPESSYFKLFGDEEEQPLQKSGAAQSFLSGFTSFFKGFQ